MKGESCGGAMLSVRAATCGEEMSRSCRGQRRRKIRARADRRRHGLGKRAPKQCYPARREPPGEDPFKIYLRAERTAHYKIREENRLRLAKTEENLDGGQRDVGGWARTCRRDDRNGETDSPFPPKRDQPDAREDVEGAGPGPAASKDRHTTPLAGMGFQQGEIFTSGNVIGGIRQCCIRCNSNAWETCQGTNTYHWHGMASIFPKGTIHASVSAMFVSFGGRKGTPPLDSVEDKKKTRPFTWWVIAL